MFKVLAVTEPNLTSVAGFERRTRRRPETEQHDVRIVAARGHSRPAPRLLHPRGRRVRVASTKASMAASARTTIRPMSRKTAAGWREQMGVAPERLLSAHQIHSPDAVVATGPWQGDEAARRRASSPAPKVSPSASPPPIADPILFVDPARARDRRGACRLEGRADRRV